MKANERLMLCATILAAMLAIPGVVFGQAQSLATWDARMMILPGDRGLTVRSLAAIDGEVKWIDDERAAAQAGSLRLIDHVVRDGQSVPVKWRLADASKTSSRAGMQASFAFVCDDPPLELRSVWRAVDGPGPVEHFLTITNKSNSVLVLPYQASLVLPLGAGNLEQWWVEKGAGTPTAVGVHRARIGQNFSSALVSSGYADGEPREPVPWMAIEDLDRHEGLYVGIESSARVKIRLDRQSMSGNGSSNGLILEMGFDPDPNFTTRLAPGETFEAAPVFVGCYQGDVDDGCNHLRHWVDAHLRPPTDDARYPLLVNNSWGSGMKIDEALCRKMIDESAALGLEMFHIDAGWFRGVGDWSANPQKFPNGLAPVADYAHSKGLKFGLWVGWTQGGIQTDPTGNHSTLSLFDPRQKDWFPMGYPPNFKPSEFTGATVCLGDSEAADWCLGALRRVVRENKLDLLEHDQTMIVGKCGRTDHLHTDSPGDIAYRAAQGYYHVQDSLRREFPNLVFEDCVNGGRQVDYGVIRRTHYVSITDTYDPLSNRRAFYDASYVLPPAMCECYIENHPGKMPANFLYMLRSGLMGWCTIMTDTTQWTAEQHRLARAEFDLYKSWLRPLIRSGNIYHVSDRPDGARWDGMQYVSPNRLSGVLFAFRGTTAEAEHTFVFKGLNPGAVYSMWTAEQPRNRLARLGRTLMSAGLAVQLAEPQSSQILLFQADAPD